MTVGEVIRILQDYPQDEQVFVDSPYHWSKHSPLASIIRRDWFVRETDHDEYPIREVFVDRYTDQHGKTHRVDSEVYEAFQPVVLSYQ